MTVTVDCDAPRKYVSGEVAPGGAAEVDPRWGDHPWWGHALDLRRCDDAAKVPGAPVPDLETLRPLLRRVARP